MIIDYLEKQIAWSRRVFGVGKRTKGVCEHIRSELLEIEAEPLDLEEWCDVMILAFDGAWRAGYSPAQIVDMLIHKQVKNSRREWSAPVSENEPVFHKKGGE